MVDFERVIAHWEDFVAPQLLTLGLLQTVVLFE